MESVEQRSRRRARELREGSTPAEEALWERLRGRQILGLKFRRQYPINRYIADFCCPELRLVIEVDGAVHDTEAQTAHDQNRGEYLQSLGYYILRFPNEEILLSSRTVLEKIAQAALHIRPSLSR
jgi:very-short-patch-repair endonuclease